MKHLLLFAAAAAALVAGCGSDSSDTAANTTAAATAGAAANRDDAMKGDAMKDDAMKGDAMKGDAMKGDAMKGDAMMKGDAAMKRAGTTLKVVDSEFGRVVANGKGEALYLFDKEQRPRSQCYGACAEAWPPVLTKGKPRAAAGTDPSLLGTTKRRDGKLQVTYAGQPLYYYVGDSPGTILCHDVDEFGGTWLVVQPNGRPAP